MAKCPKCDTSVRNNAKFCAECGHKLNLAANDSPNLTDAITDDAIDFAKTAYGKVENISRTIVKDDKGSKIMAGAAVGAASGAVLPVVGWIFGAAVGAGIAAYNYKKK